MLLRQAVDGEDEERSGGFDYEVPDLDDEKEEREAKEEEQLRDLMKAAWEFMYPTQGRCPSESLIRTYPPDHLATIGTRPELDVRWNKMVEASRARVRSQIDEAYARFKCDEGCVKRRGVLEISFRPSPDKACSKGKTAACIMELEGATRVYCQPGPTP